MDKTKIAHGWIRKKYFKPDKTGQSNSNWILTDLITFNQLDTN
ncbi:hypothetical protein [Salipaludibacillus sp. CF4.18]